MSQFSYHQAPYLAFFSEKFYRDVKQNWKGTGFLYLFLFLGLLSALTMYAYHVGLVKFVDSRVAAVIQQFPRIDFKKGNAVVTGEQPIYIKDVESGTVLVIIDTTGATTTSNLTEPTALITKNKIIFHDPKNGQSREIFLTELEGTYIDAAKLTGWAASVKKWGAIIVFPILWISSFVYRMLQALLYAAVGILIAKWLSVKFEYIDLIRLSVMAVTPVLILNTLLGMIPMPLAYWPLICFVIAMLYLRFAIQAGKTAPVNPQT